MFQPLRKDEKNAEKIVRPSLTYWADAWRRLKQNKLAIISLIALAVIVIMALIGPIISPYEYDFQDFTAINQSPSAEHWFGTDDLGRDLFVRAWKGARVSLLIGLVSAVINVTIGIIYGGIAGYKGGRTDSIMMRIVEIIYSIPALLWVILLMIIMGQGLTTIIVALSMSGWGADYDDPMTFMALHVTDGGNNHAFYSSEEYDALINKAQTEQGEERVKAMVDAEKLLAEDLPIFPLYNATKQYLQKEYVKGVERHAAGADLSFKNAYILKH